jgi:hypothetical protein
MDRPTAAKSGSVPGPTISRLAYDVTVTQTLILDMILVAYFPFTEIARLPIEDIPR